MDIVIFFGTLVVVVSTMLPVLRVRHWFVRGMDFPRLQIAYLAAALLVVQFFFLDLQSMLDRLLILVVSLCLLWQLWWILPYTFFWVKEVETSRNYDFDRQLSVITANVLQTNRDSKTLIELVQQYQPDILVTLESDQWWESRLDELAADMPHSVKCPLENFYGMHVYSRLPFNEQEIVYLVEKNVPSIHVSVTLRTGDKVRMYFLHPAPPSPTENTESIERDVELIAVARSIAEIDQPVVITGDLNDVAWSATTRQFRKISGLLDPRVGRGMFNTFHVDYAFLRWPLDYLFHSSEFRLKTIRRLPSIGSDHFALYTVLSFEPAASAVQEGLAATNADHQDAKKTMEELPVSENDVPRLDT